MIRFLLTNPGHHREAMAPVVAILRARGHHVEAVSLAELRGFRTPDAGDWIRALPPFRSSPAAGRSLGGGPAATGATPAQQAMWHGVLRPRLRWLLRGSAAVVVPNDTAWPYGPLCASLRRRGRPFVLMQEGIRFPLPGEAARGAAYGGAGAAAICAWGEASAEHFRSVAPARSVQVTGTPRFDGVDPEAWRPRGERLLRELGLTRAPVAFLSNPIDDMGYCDTATKLDLFERFARASLPVLRSEGRAMVAKLHPREDAEAFRQVAARVGTEVRVVQTDLNAVLAASCSAVVLASTVGLEAMIFGLPVGVVALPGHGHVFEYVARGAAVGLQADAGCGPLLSQPPPASAREAFVERHIARRGRAAEAVADVVADVAAGREPSYAGAS